MQKTSQVASSVQVQFLHLCLRGLWDPSALLAAAALAGEEPLDWAALCRVAGTEGLAPLLYHIVRERQMVPPAVEQELEDHYYRLLAHNLPLLHELERILSALAADAVPVLLLKGAALLETAYDNAGLRVMDDLDLLVPMARAKAADSTLAGLGYSMTTADPWPGFSRRYRYCVGYTRPSGGEVPFYVGVHTVLFDVPFYERIPVSDWFTRAQPVPGASSGARMPAPEDHLVYLCGHLALHHPHDPALRRLVDIALLIRWAGKGLNWSLAVQRAVQWRLVIPLQRTLARLQELWPGLVPPGVAAEVAQLQALGSEQRVHHWVAERHRTPASHTLLALATLPGVARRARMLLELAFPSPAYMRQRYCRQHPSLWPLAYLRRAGLAFHHLLQHLR